MGWLSDNLKRHSSSSSSSSSGSSSSTNHLGILAFETAKTMSRLVSLYKSLSESELSNLRTLVKSQGVSYLNSRDESFLLSLACAERLEDLDKSATNVARLGHKCSDFGLNRFDLVYTDLKLGIIDLGKLEYGSKDTQKKIEKMEKLISATSKLYSALESLSELEISERKIKQWKQNTTRGGGGGGLQQHQSTNFDLFNQKVSYQRKQVRHFRETSLWSQTFDKSVGLMARIVCILYARICIVFGPYYIFSITTFPYSSRLKHSNNNNINKVQTIESIKEQIISRSGPIPMNSGASLVRFHSHKSIIFSSENSVNNRVFHMAAPSTVGGSGLGLRYANVIVLAEKYLDSEVTIGDDAREGLYQMLPENLKVLVRSKLRNVRAAAEKGSGGDDQSLAEAWREALGEIMGWLSPMAQDTIRWQTERNVERMKFDSKPTALLLHTLHFSDREKVEATIAEVLVGLSYIYQYQNRGGGDGVGDGGGVEYGIIGGGRCSFDGITW